jgi:hypothetical protein
MSWMSEDEKERLRGFKRQAKENREKRKVAYHEFSRLVLREKLDPEVAKLQICGRFGYSPIQWQNVLNLRVDLDPTTVVDMDATIQRYIEKGKTAVDEAWGNLDDELEKLDLMEEEGLDGVLIEVVETTGTEGGEGDRTVTKKQPISEARMRLMERKLEIAGRFMDRIASIAGKDAMAQAIGKTKVVVNIDATEEFKNEFKRMRGLGNEKVTVDVATTVGDIGSV